MNSATKESPPGLIAFPAANKIAPRADAGSLVASLLPAPPAAPRSMALTKLGSPVLPFSPFFGSRFATP